MTSKLFLKRIPLAVAALGGVFMAFHLGGFAFGAFLFVAAALIQDRLEPI